MKIDEMVDSLNVDLETRQKVRQLLEEQRRRQMERQSEGIRRAQQRGVRFGRPRAQIPHIETICRMYVRGELSLDEACNLCGVSRSTIYRRICEYRSKTT